MKAHIVVTDNEGRVFEGEATFAAVPSASLARRATGRRTLRTSREALDFDLPVRPFMKRHAKNLGGPGKFTMLLARLTKGKVAEPKRLEDIRKTWNRMKQPMGGRFNPAHTTRAKDNGWVDTPKPGIYVLLPRWSEALGRK